MPRRPVSLLSLGLGALAVLALASCGGEDAKLLPGETAREITANLNTVQQLAGEGDCLGAESAAAQVSEQVDELGGVDRRLKQALEEGTERLNEVIAECEETEAIAPAEVPGEDEAEEAEPSKQEEKEAKEREKEEEKAAKQEPEPPKPPAEEGEPPLPPQAKGEGKGLENGNAPPAEEGETGGEGGPSGGLGPGNAVGEG